MNVKEELYEKNNKVVIILISIVLFLGYFIYFSLVNSDKISVNDLVINTNYQSQTDDEYRRNIILNSHNSNYTLSNISVIVGPNELINIIKQNDSNSLIYIPNKENMTYGANFHIHTTNSDGKTTVAERLNEAQKYAEKLPSGKFYI